MEIRPFRGWHYRPGTDGDVSAFIAPPYDVLSAADKAALLKQSERNVVAVDLPHVPPGDAGKDELYRRAAELLNEWKASGVLVQEQAPAIYVYEQSFEWAGKSYSRTAVICGVRGSQPGGDVKLHERTYPGPKADRLKLTQHTRMQLSAVLGFYRDGSGRARELLSSATAGRPDLKGTLRGVAERVWLVTDEAVIRKIASHLRDKPVFIADGHHRYMTALSYRDALVAEGRIGRDHEANFVMFSLVEAGSPGLLVLPTHRIISGLKEGFSVEKLAAAAPQFSWQRRGAAEADLADADAFLRRCGPGSMAFIGAGPPEVWIARLADAGAMVEAAPDQTDAWRRLDVAILHKLIIDNAIEPWRTGEFSIEYTPEAARVLAACRSGRGQLGICLRATPLSAVEEIALAGQSMPHKSTYFYPKVATGLVFKPLE
ncbi:MAG TPA: DUF1015 domain-containing protein [Phycisphaerae bacterium]|nr:DUF1015 domain-containing protein [Phycisphaerae bacterium]